MDSTPSVWGLQRMPELAFLPTYTHLLYYEVWTGPRRGINLCCTETHRLPLREVWRTTCLRGLELMSIFQPLWEGSFHPPGWKNFFKTSNLQNGVWMRFFVCSQVLKEIMVGSLQDGPSDPQWLVFMPLYSPCTLKEADLFNQRGSVIIVVYVFWGEVIKDITTLPCSFLYHLLQEASVMMWDNQCDGEVHVARNWGPCQ